MRSHEWPTGWTARSPQDEDVVGVLGLLNARSRMTVGTDTFAIEDVERWWTGPRFDRSRDFLILFDERDTVVGTAATDDWGAPFAFIGSHAGVHPSHQDREDVWDALHAWSLRRVAEIAKKPDVGVRVAAVETAYGVDSARQAALERAGFQPVRISNRMGIDLDDAPPEPVWPEGVSLRMADIEGDQEALIDAHEEIWRDH